MGISERQKEIKRRRHRRAKIRKLQLRAATASLSDKQVIAEKLRRLTPGAKQLTDRIDVRS